MEGAGNDVSQTAMTSESNLRQQLIIGLTVGGTCMLLWTVIIFAVMVARHSAKKDRQRRELEGRRNRPPDLHPVDHMGLDSRLGEHRQQANFHHLAYSSRSFSPGRPAADTPTFLDGFSPRMLPLHGYNEPFVGRHKDEFSITGLTSVSSSVRSGAPAIVPFRSSQLPLRDNIQFSYEGRVDPYSHQQSQESHYSRQQSQESHYSRQQSQESYSRQLSQENEPPRRNVVYDDPPDRRQKRSRQQRKVSTGSRKVSSSSSSNQEIEMTTPARRGHRRGSSPIKHGFTTWSIRPQENPIGPTRDRHRHQEPTYAGAARAMGGSPTQGRPSNSSTETHASGIRESSHGASVYSGGIRSGSESEVPPWATTAVSRPSNSSTETHASGPKTSTAGMLHRVPNEVGAVGGGFLPEEEPDPGYLPLSWSSPSLGRGRHGGASSPQPGTSHQQSSYGVRSHGPSIFSSSPPLNRPPPLSRNPTEASLNFDDDDNNVWLPRNSPSLQRTAGSLLGYSVAHSDCSSSSGSDLHRRSNIPSFVAAEYDRICEPSDPVNIPRVESGFEFSLTKAATTAVDHTSTRILVDSGVEEQSKTVDYPLPDSGYYDDLLHRTSPPR